MIQFARQAYTGWEKEEETRQSKRNEGSIERATASDQQRATGGVVAREAHLAGRTLLFFLLCPHFSATRALKQPLWDVSAGTCTPGVG